jgi:hypothetical protein
VRWGYILIVGNDIYKLKSSIDAISGKSDVVDDVISYSNEKTKHLYLPHRRQSHLPLPLVQVRNQHHSLQPYTLLHTAEYYDHLVGFVTKLEEGREHKGIDKIENYSKYGTLLKIQKADGPSHLFFERNKSTLINYLGLTFARYILYN